MIPKNMSMIGLTVLVMLFVAPYAFGDHPSIGLGGDVAGPITTLSAAPLSEGTWSVGLRVEYQDLEEISDERLTALSEAHQNVHSVDNLWNLSLIGNYGLTEDLTVGLSLPYVKRTNVREPEHVHGAPDEVVELGDSEGLGDLRLFGQYRFLHNAVHKADTAFILGIKTPTGEDDETIDQGAAAEHGHEENGEAGHGHGNEFEAEHQPGSGSWDPFFGIAHSRKWNAISLHASLLYTVATEGVQDTDLGDSLHYNLAIAHRLGGGEHHHAHSHAGHPHSHGGGLAWDLMMPAAFLARSASWVRCEIRSRSISAAIEKAIAMILLWMLRSSCQ